MNFFLLSLTQDVSHSEIISRCLHVLFDNFGRIEGFPEVY
jgi:hypothetical protein